MHNDRRDFTRVPLRFPVHVVVEGREWSADHGLDVSAQGIFVDLAKSFEIGAQAEIEIELETSTHIRASGHVVRSDGARTAFAFDAVEPRGYELLKNLILYHAPDLERAEQEFAEHEHLDQTTA